MSIFDVLKRLTGITVGPLGVQWAQKKDIGDHSREDFMKAWPKISRRLHSDCDRSSRLCTEIATFDCTESGIDKHFYYTHRQTIEPYNKYLWELISFFLNGVDEYWPAYRAVKDKMKNDKKWYDTFEKELNASYSKSRALLLYTAVLSQEVERMDAIFR